MNKFRNKYILSHAHPIKFLAEILGVISSAYLLWIHNWIWAIIASVFFFLFSTLLLWNKTLDLEKIAKTSLGKIMIVYTTPVNFFLYNVSVIPFIFGLWTHNFLYVLLGIFLLFLPHLSKFILKS